MVDNSPYTPMEALEAYALNWRTLTAPLYWQDGTEKKELPTGHRATYRSDAPSEPLGVVSRKYRPIHNIDIARSLEAALPNPRCIVAGGTYRQGKRVWLQADLGRMSIGGVDPVQRYAVFYSDHDGGGALRVCPATFRLFCLNQLNAATKDQHTVTIRHTGDVGNITQHIRSALDGSAVWLERFERAANTLADDASIDGGWLSRYFQRAYLATCSDETRALLLKPGGDDARQERAERAAGRAALAVADMARNYADCDGGQLNQRLMGTRWHAFNAATEWVDNGGRFGDESKQLGTAARAKLTMLNEARSLSVT